METKPSAPKKQRTADGPSGIAIQLDSVDGENGAAAGFCLTCVKRMSQGIFDGENISLKKPADGPVVCPACVNKMPWKSLIVRQSPRRTSPGSRQRRPPMLTSSVSSATFRTRIRP